VTIKGNLHIRLTILTGFLLLFSTLRGQSLYLISFCDKGPTPVLTIEGLSPHTLARRAKQGLPPTDFYDLPLYPPYVQLIQPQVDSVRYALRWLNAVSVSATTDQIQEISLYPFVSEIIPLEQSLLISEASPQERNIDTLLWMQRNLMQLDTLQGMGLTGEGVRIAILDVGFEYADKHTGLAEVFEEARILKTRDFYDGDKNVYHHDIHGTNVLACIAGKFRDGQWLGCAPKAEFLLARTEHKIKEKPVEEDHWMAAVEWAYNEGADIVNTSIGFVAQNNAFELLDGKTLPVCKTAQIAVDKGMIVISAMGNQGDKRKDYLNAPSDVPGVLSVGGSYPMIHESIKFSSVGPNAAGILKPDVSAPAFVVGLKKKEGYGEVAGTSYATPMIAGLVACLLQKEDSLHPSQVSERLRKSGHFYPYFDYELGFGIAQAPQLFEEAPMCLDTTFDVRHVGDTIFVTFDEETMLDTLAHPYGPNLHFHFQEPEGNLIAYKSFRMTNEDREYYFLLRRYIKGVLRIWFQGYLYEEIYGDPASLQKNGKQGQ